MCLRRLRESWNDESSSPRPCVQSIDLAEHSPAALVERILTILSALLADAGLSVNSQRCHRSPHSEVEASTRFTIVLAVNLMYAHAAQ